MKVLVVSPFKNEIRKYLKRAGIKESKNPELIIAYGGDGTFLFSEEKYPYLPKIFIYKSKTCKEFCPKNVEEILKNLKKIKMIKMPLLEAEVNGKKIRAINDINIHYNPPKALRFRLNVNKKVIADNVIGDGVVVCTPFGSNAYFKSITKKNFRKGIGIAFNNPVKKKRPLVVPETAKIEIEILREEGIVVFDGSNKKIKIKKGSKITIKECKKKTAAAIFKNS